MPGWLPAAALYGWLYPRAAAIIAQTRAIAEQIESLSPASAPRIHALPNPVDETRLRAGVSPSKRGRGGLQLVAAGRLTHQKGFDRLIDLMPELPKETQLTIYGEGAERNALQALIDRRFLGSQVRLAGFSTELSKAISEADVFVLPSRWEGMPNVVLEALALGTPVVASEESGVEGIAGAAEAVMIASIGPDFVRAIMRHSPGPVTSLRASLLPAEYRIEAVATRFNALLADVAGRS
jgi:glycosyltransferase involved in cell wall biosynthesis